MNGKTRTEINGKMPAGMRGGIRTTCPYCGVGCGVLAKHGPGSAITIAGDPRHPANFGRLCSKGAALGETLETEGRLLHPVVDGAAADWETALGAVAGRFAETVRRYGPEAVAFYVSGQLLTEDYYVANKLMKGFIGAANIDTNSRLCMSSSVAGHKRAFGSDTVPGCYGDLEQARLIVLAGSNAAWCHPVLYQRIRAAKAAGSGVQTVVIDPRRTASCEGADRHLAIRPGTDAVLFNGLLVHLHRRGAADTDFLASHTRGLEVALRAAQDSAPDAATVARICGLKRADVEWFFERFAQTENVVTAYSQGINQSTSGTDKVTAILNCHLLTGRIGRPGMGPFSLTGQPNAMGGREVGGLANQLAAHLEIENPAHRALVRRFWNAPTIADKPGLKAVELFDAIAAGRVKAVWIMATNPVDSLPDADRVRAALRRCDLVVVSDCVRHTDTADLAHILLPAAAWGEKDGTVTNSERRISRQRAFLPLPGEARPDWWIVCEVARRMGFGDAFAYTSPAQIFREHATLSGLENGGRRDFDISAFAGIDEAGYEALTPVQWPVTEQSPRGTARLFAQGGFFTPDGKARLHPVRPRPPANAPDGAFPLILNTGRLRDHWHTMTRTGGSPRLSAHATGPVAEIHPDDARAAAVADGALVEVASKWGRMTARARVTADQRQGSIFLPIHWTDQFAARARVGALVNPACDPRSGQPESKHTPVRIAPFHARWQALALSRRPLPAPPVPYWVRAAGAGFWRYELAGETVPDDWDAWARQLFSTPDGETEWLAYRDDAAGHYRCAALAQGRLQACLFVVPGEPAPGGTASGGAASDGAALDRPAPDNRPAPAQGWLGGFFSGAALSAQARTQLLAGRPPRGMVDDGPVVCSCFGVGRDRIIAAVKAGGLSTVDEIGTALSAGTNCGSCRPELAEILRRTRADTDPEGTPAREPAPAMP